jgi:predicted  nucleic acid-binding Zn-ribbon protein
MPYTEYAVHNERKPVEYAFEKPHSHGYSNQQAIRPDIRNDAHQHTEISGNFRNKPQPELIHPADASLSNADLRIHYDDLRGRMDALIHENEMLRRCRSSEVYAYSLQINELQEQNQSMSTQIESLQVTADHLESEKNLLKDEIVRLNHENLNSKAVIKDLELRCAALEEQKRELQQSVDTQTKEFSSLKEEKVASCKYDSRVSPPL